MKFACKHCGQEYMWRANRDKHVAKCEDNPSRLQICEVCGTRFRTWTDEDRFCVKHADLASVLRHEAEGGVPSEKYQATLVEDTKANLLKIHKAMS